MRREPFLCVCAHGKAHHCGSLVTPSSLLGDRLPSTLDTRFLVRDLIFLLVPSKGHSCRRSCAVGPELWVLIDPSFLEAKLSHSQVSTDLALLLMQKQNYSLSQDLAVQERNRASPGYLRRSLNDLCMTARERRWNPLGQQ